MAREWWTAFSLDELARLTAALDALPPALGDAPLRAKLSRATLGLLRWNRRRPLPFPPAPGGRR